MDIVTPAVNQYLDSMLPDRDEVLQEMEVLSQKQNIPIIGPVVARILYQLVRLVKARTIFEMGSAIGYSTIWIARAAGEGSVVYYSDSDPENARRAEEFFKRAGVRDRIQMLQGNALDLLDQTPGQFDVIFNDVDKRDYPQVFHKAMPRIRKGGLFVTDNVLWSGRVMQSPQDDDTRGIVEFNRLNILLANAFPYHLARA